MSPYSKIFIISCLFFLPLFPLMAADNYLVQVMTTFKSVIALALPAFIGLAIIGFASGIFVYLYGGAEEKEQGKNLIIWGGLAVIVLLSLYALAGLLQDLTGARGLNVDIPTTYKGPSGGTRTETED